MLALLLILLFCICGVFVGVITGLLPGLHVNNISLILLSASGAIVALCAPLNGYGFSESFVFLLICCFILGVSTSHAVVEIIPATFLQ